MTRILTLAALLLPTAAFAHPGDHAHAGLTHLLTQPDHLTMIAAGAVAALLVAYRLWARK